MLGTPADTEPLDGAYRLRPGGGIQSINHRRLLEPIGNVPPAEAEARYDAQAKVQALAA
ncbi:hypothetical protein PQI07_35540 [Methylobacterium sp. 092160098-2]|uniref:hypothetical protein n=1 Tax=Methylobacterium sp. 092160098-2 TaxID=3025129 RepID=UPI002381CE9A|nr:hypothetical protein [Methylobacterium sp. 092160098-2]MDE4915898.1 hypothetical protein [Methylobacterium sp. 092160098-2]